MLNYKVVYSCSNPDNTVSTFSSYRKIDSFQDRSNQLLEEYAEDYRDDKNFHVISITRSDPNNDTIDYSLIDRMHATISLCELARKVRAESKIRNRQPLSNLYVVYSNNQIHDSIVYCDGKDFYRKTFSNELNVDNVDFISDTNRFFDYKLKPNFRTLGPKGFGKQAQSIKTYFSTLSPEEGTAFYKALKLDSIEVNGVPLTVSDVETEFVAKAGYCFASDKTGAVVLDINLTPELLDRGFISDLRSIIQNQRKQDQFLLTDYVDVEIFCNDNQHIINQYSKKVMQDVLAKTVSVKPISDCYIFNKYTVLDKDYYIRLTKSLS